MSDPREPTVYEAASRGLLRIERVLLKDRAADQLRSQIIRGRIPPGTKLTERKIAHLLGISRIPARDALLQLEQEGLLVQKSNSRCVIELSERDVSELYQVRIALEKLAVELAARNTSPENRAVLLAKLQEMHDVISRGDVDAYVATDVETHRLIWEQSGNRHLLNTLDSMVGSIFGFIASNAEHYDWQETWELHRDTVDSINSGDVRAAVASIERHLDNALQRSLRALALTKHPAQTAPSGASGRSR